MSQDDHQKQGDSGVVIYALKHPLTGEVRYIGKTKNIAQRMKGHLRGAREKDTPLYRWMRKLDREGLTPEFLIILKVEGDWQEAERAEIAKARAAGLRLLNVADGGEQPYCPPEVRSGNLKKAYQNNPYLMRAYRKIENLIVMAKRDAKKGATECPVELVLTLRAAKEKLMRTAAYARLTGKLPLVEEMLKNDFLRNDRVMKKKMERANASA